MINEICKIEDRSLLLFDICILLTFFFFLSKRLSTIESIGFITSIPIPLSPTFSEFLAPTSQSTLTFCFSSKKRLYITLIVFLPFSPKFAFAFKCAF